MDLQLDELAVQKHDDEPAVRGALDDEPADDDRFHDAGAADDLGLNLSINIAF